MTEDCSLQVLQMISGGERANIYAAHVE